MNYFTAVLCYMLTTCIMVISLYANCSENVVAANALYATDVRTDVLCPTVELLQ
jgi:hypothetical protein